MYNKKKGLKCLKRKRNKWQCRERRKVVDKKMNIKRRERVREKDKEEKML
jgi:hypothetical protein